MFESELVTLVFMSYTGRQKQKEFVRGMRKKVPLLSSLSVGCEREMDAERRVTRSLRMSFRLGNGTEDEVAVFVIGMVVNVNGGGGVQNKGDVGEKQKKTLLCFASRQVGWLANFGGPR